MDEGCMGTRWMVEMDEPVRDMVERKDKKFTTN